MKSPYSRKELFTTGTQREFSGPELAMVSFPLGGIGTGSIGLSGRGGLIDWEVFNRPNLGSTFPRTFPIIWARARGDEPVCRVLQAKPLPPFQGSGHGDPFASGEGFPHMDTCTFRGEYPFASLRFKCRALPVKVSLEAYNPFIPSNPDDSGFPAAILRYTLTNKQDVPVDASIAWSMLNMVGSIGNAERDPNPPADIEFGFGRNINTYVEQHGLRGLMFTSKKWKKAHPRFGSMALLTPSRRVTVLRQWGREPHFSPMHEFWDTFSAKGTFPDRDLGPSEDGRTDTGAVGVRARLKPGESRVITFYLTWYFPNFEKYWGATPCCDSPGCAGNATRAVWKNHYAKQFTSALDVAAKLHAREDELRAKTQRFHKALFSSTLPAHVLDAVSSQMAILKTATCLRLADGTFYGFEGCSPTSGCCEGSCTHVWNYQQALPFLFPSLERSMRTADYRHNLRKDGGMGFRLQLPLGTPPNEFHAAADGQLGGIIKTYRDWRISGDDAWLKKLWPKVRKALEYAWVQWDQDRDGVIDGIQHNTYDIEFLGPNPLTTAFYLAALEAGARIAEAVGQPEPAEEYRAIAAKGRAWVEEHLFNGTYYEQHYDPKKAPLYQFGRGCLSDQLLGLWLGTVAGLDPVLDRRQVRKALKSIFKYNWRPGLEDHANPQRVYALNDEAGLLLCSWPRGGRPAVPFIYSDEVWTGIEYQVASHLITEGMLLEGLSIVKGVRDRHDGLRRNPWNEFECGSHYARAMASYGLLLALSGFTYNKGAGRIGFEPKIEAEKFACFWALDGAWGRFKQREGKASLTCDYGSITLNQVDLPRLGGGRKVTVTLGDSTFTVNKKGAGFICFPEPVELTEGAVLRFTR